MSSNVFFAVLLALTASLATASIFNRRVTSEEDDYQENILSPVGGQSKTKDDWMEVSQTNARVLRVPAGHRVELECEVLGKPPPTAAQWFKGSTPITQGDSVEETNLITGVGLGKLISRLVIDCVEPHHRGLYTCRAVSGGQTRVSSPSALTVQGEAKPCPKHNHFELKPKISTWSPLILENMFNDVILPCSVQGSPKPKITWLDENKNEVGNDPMDSRKMVTDSGNLIIRRLRWEDMGGYTCVAENKHGRETRLTFLYPMLNEG